MAIEAISRRSALSLLIGGSCALAACKRHKNLAGRTEEEAPHMAYSIIVADPATASQLAAGFYDVEQNSWRWTRKRFAAVLGLPPGAAQRGAVLRLTFAIPEVIISNLKSITVSATIRGTALDPETYTKAGPAIYERDVPPNLLTGDSARVDFLLDKALPPGDVDKRELGVVVNRIGLEIK
ncbi:MAG TPA: hypothetical protein VJN43_09155 [Bryobacteraceae bacterium]|nr:hypothetical protein [Bryobacteraceae bacterium]